MPLTTYNGKLIYSSGSVAQVSPYEEIYYVVDNRIKNMGAYDTRRYDDLYPLRFAYDNGGYMLWRKYQKAHSSGKTFMNYLPVYSINVTESGSCLVDVFVKVFKDGTKLIVPQYFQRGNDSTSAWEIKPGTISQFYKNPRYFVNIVAPHVPPYEEIMRTVSGSNSADINGNYVQWTTYNNKTRYKHETNSYYILYSTLGYWMITDAIDDTGNSYHIRLLSLDVKGSYTNDAAGGNVVVT